MGAAGYGSEGEARLKLFQKMPARLPPLHDFEGVYIDIANGEAH